MKAHKQGELAVSDYFAKVLLQARSQAGSPVAASSNQTLELGSHAP